MGLYCRRYENVMYPKHLCYGKVVCYVMARDNVINTRLSDSEYEPIETIMKSEGCSESEAVRKCVRVMRVYSDEKILDIIQSEEFEAITKLMSD